MTSFISYAQNFEDVLLWRALGRIKNGTYIDIGAQHPLEDSVSMAFYERGWRGLHVEPVQYYVELLRKHRQGDVVIQAALASKKGKIRFFELADTGLSTGSLEVFRQHSAAGLVGRESVVDAVTLSSIFGKLRNVEIHWMKIDVEGMELDVLRGWQRSASRPWVVVVESTLPNSQTEAHASWEPELVGRGYRFAYFDGLNRYYVASKHQELLALLRCGANVFDRFVPVSVVRLEKEVNHLAGRNALLTSYLDEMEDAVITFGDSTINASESLTDKANRIRAKLTGDQLEDSPLGCGQSRIISVVRGKSASCLYSGFSLPEDWGTWSNALVSTIEIPVDQNVPPNMEMTVRLSVRVASD
ncbi:MAG: FkbM family methyltransferase, partial [Usitatibacteraceae bacterium]